MKKERVINCIELIIFVFLALCIGKYHEPWVDEAQSWLIARDNSFCDIIWNISRYEGTFPLWFIVLKICIYLGLSYKYIYFVSVIFSTIGVFVLLKTKCPTYIKILLPFTYYVFYQYGIIARSYCMMFLAFSLLILTYSKRFEKPNVYIVVLLYFSFISMHGMVISIILSIMFFIENIKLKKLKIIYSFFIMLIVFIIEIIILCPRNDLFININAVFGMKFVLYRIFYNLIICEDNILLTIQNCLVIGLLCIIVIKSSIIKENRSFVITEIFLGGFLLSVRSVPHHFGIMFLLVVSGIIINYDEIKNKYKYFEKYFFIILVFYCIYGVQASYLDLKNDYSGSKKMAEYIQNNVNFDEKKIYTIGYYSTSVSPYFDYNIFKNKDKTYYEWSTNNKFFYYLNNWNQYGNEVKSVFINDADYILVDNRDISEQMDLVKSIIDSNLFELDYESLGNTIYKNKNFEKEGFMLFKRK